MEVREPSAKYLVQAKYKQTEVGVIPEDWDIQKLGNLAIVRDGTHQTPKYVPVGIPFFSVEQVTSGNFEDTKYISEKEHQFLTRSFRIEKGDILMTRIGSIGDCKLVDWDVDASFYVSLALLKVRGASAAFIAQYSKSAAFKAEVELHSLQSAIPKKINLGPISEVRVALPPITEQQSIAEALSDADALIESLEKLLAKKRQIKQGAMQELLTGQRRLPGFAGAWEEKSMEELFSFGGGFTASRDQLGVDGYCYLHYGDIHASGKPYVDVMAEYSEIPKLETSLGRIGRVSMLGDGDVVFVDASEDDEGTSKHVVVINPDGIPFISGLHTIVARSKTDELEDSYKQFCFQTASVKAQFRFFAVGTKVSGISKTNIGKIVLRLPPPAEQSAIAAILSDMDAEITALEAKLAKARSVKQGMMQELLTGRIRLV